MSYMKRKLPKDLVGNLYQLFKLYKTACLLERVWQQKLI